MSVGPSSGIIGSAAGAPLAQTKGNETTRAAQRSSAQQTQQQNEQAAADASGIGQTEEDQGAGERDADGRRLWERPPESERKQVQNEPEADKRRVADPQGHSGQQIDLSG